MIQLAKTVLLSQGGIVLPSFAEYGILGAVIALLIYLYMAERSERKDLSTQLIEVGATTTEALTRATIVMNKETRQPLPPEELRRLIEDAVERALAKHQHK